MSFFLIGADDNLFELPANKQVTIGRAGVNQIVLNDRLVSRIHARIAPSASGPLLTDRGSANGVQVNGRTAWETVLRPGDSVQIGQAVFHVFAGTPAEAKTWITTRRDDTARDRNTNHFHPTDILGDLAGLPIVTLLQTLISQQQPGALTLTQAGELVGKIYIDNGAFAAAMTVSGLTNKDALFKLMQLHQGQFVFQRAVRPPASDIQENAAALILEGCQRLDEKRALATA